MQCDDIDALLIEYLDGNLSPAMRSTIDKHLTTCAACRHNLKEYQMLFGAMEHNRLETPGLMLREKFDAMLQSEINIDATSTILKKEETSKIKAVHAIPLWMRVAASIILVAGGVLIGMKLMPQKEDGNAAQIANLNKEVKEMKEALMFNLLKDESASERIKAVNYVDEIINPDPTIINALIHTLNTDKNVNVRLAALYSIEKFSASQAVRDSLVNSLSKQTEPVMQIVLINILTESKEVKAIAPIKKILSDKKSLQPVKDIAQRGLKLL